MRRICRGQVPNVLQLLDSFEDNSHIYVVTKYFPSGDLQDVVMKNDKYKNGMPEDTVKVILRQLVTAV